VDPSDPTCDEASRYVAEQLAIGKECLAAALDYLARGWSPVPLCHPHHHGNGKEHCEKCGSPGKAPLVCWTEYQDRRPSRKELEDWWRWWPQSGVGILLGPVSGLVGLDIDGATAEAELRKLSEGDLPPTLEFRTPRPGRRLLYRLPEGADRPNATFPFPDGELKVMGKGTMSVMPPSRHENGGIYTWEVRRVDA
jgi:hypothetical protein